ncbi:MAG: HEAT repeat domain-containing protein [Micavibrio aeruginosavorus]|nr:HEAT repeat domain-containing protein [Micavibrio aeruginosavorus]
MTVKWSRDKAIIEIGDTIADMPLDAVIRQFNTATDPVERNNAARSLGIRAVENAPLWPMVVALFAERQKTETDPGARWQMVYWLGRIGGNHQASAVPVMALLADIFSEETDADTRAGSLIAMAMTAESFKTVLAPALKNMLSAGLADPHEKVRKAGVRGLVWLATEWPAESRRILDAILPLASGDPAISVRKEAIGGIGTIGSGVPQALGPSLNALEALAANDQDPEIRTLCEETAHGIKPPPQASRQKPQPPKKG